VALTKATGAVMSLDFRDGKTFPRRGRTPLGGFLWLARAFDKARAKQSRTQDGYIYPCPMDRAMMRRWGVKPSEFTGAASASATDDQILSWMSSRVSEGQMQTANAWLSRQTYALDRHDAQEGVPGAKAPGLPWREIVFGIAIAAAGFLAAWFIIR